VKRLGVLAFFLLVLPGCSVTAGMFAPLRNPTLPHPYYPLLAPATYGRTYAARHLLEGQARGQDFVFQVQVEIDTDRIVLVGFTPWQTRAFLVRYDGQTLTYENFTDREIPFPAAFMLSYLQQVLWPRLPNQGEWHVVEDPHTHERRVSFRQQLVTRIRYHGAPSTQGDVELTNMSLGYRLLIHIDPGSAGVAPANGLP